VARWFGTAPPGPDRREAEGKPHRFPWARPSLFGPNSQLWFYQLRRGRLNPGARREATVRRFDHAGHEPVVGRMQVAGRWIVRPSSLNRRKRPREGLLSCEASDAEGDYFARRLNPAAGLNFQRAVRPCLT